MRLERITRGSGNVFRDLGLPNWRELTVAANVKIKAALEGAG